jgi:phage terminase Nu1 subunit (DNA packaging protein)
MQLAKPYDPQALVQALKAQGIEKAEETVKVVNSVVCDWLRSSMEQSKDGIVGHLDDLAIPLVNSFEKLVNSKLDDLAAKLAEAPAPAADPVPAPASVPPASA